jgi:signal transduction histidine kinase/ligand-binding sensor domain-containing protein
VSRLGVGLLTGLLSLAPLTALPAGTDSAGGQDYLVRVWGADEGLTEGSVTDVAQTPEGYLWLGTLFGSVLRFDGVRFTSYNAANTPEFSQKWGVPRLMVGYDGTLWISALDGGLATWDHDGFHSVLSSANQPERLLWSGPGRVLFVFGDGKLLSGRQEAAQWKWENVTLPGALPRGQHCADAEGRVWYVRGNGELGVWDGKDAKSLVPGFTLAGQAIKVLTADAKRRIWLGTDHDLALWQTDHFEVMTPTNGELVLQVKRVVPSGNGELWVEANGRMRRCAGRRWLAESEGWNQELGRLRSLRFVHGDAKGGLWAGVGDLGLIHVRPDGTYVRLTTREGLPSNNVHFAYQDREDNTWLGYERGGLVQVRRRLFHTIGKNEGLQENLINTVCQDHQGAVWLGTHSGIVGRYENGVCTNLTLPGSARPQDSSVVADAQGRVWIGAQRLGLMMWDAGEMRQVAGLQQPEGFARLMLPARDGQLWIGTAGSVWSIVRVNDGKLSVVYSARDTGEHATALAEGANGTVWAGTLAGFLLRWNGERFVALEPPDRASLGRLWALWPTADGGLWAGTEEGGLLRWRDGSFRRCTTKNGLPSDCIAQILGDEQGNLWLGTRVGIVRIKQTALTRFERGELEELPVSVYGQSDGLLTIGSAITFQPNCWRGRDGTLFFAMANSVATVKPEEVHMNPVPPTVVLEEVRADDQRVWPPHIGGILSIAEGASAEAQRAAVPEIAVGPGRGDLEFRYAGLSLASPSRVRFKYKLENSDTAWNDAGGERRAVYRHVPPGRYLLHVIAWNSDSVCGPESTLLAVTVKPHLYQTAWFRGGVGLGAVAGMSLGVIVGMRRRLHRRLEQLQRQHALERERAHIAQDLHDELGAGLTEIGLLGGLLQQPAGLSERGPLALPRIVQRCRDLVTALDEIVWAVNPRNDSVNALSGYLCRYAQGFLEPTLVRCRLEVQEAEPDRPVSAEERHNLFLAFKEALTNVVRHSGATEVTIKIGREGEGRLLICIEDNGQGLPPVMGEGADGLENLRQRMGRIGGHCDIANRPGGGVAVRLISPLSALRGGGQ